MKTKVTNGAHMVLYKATLLVIPKEKKKYDEKNRRSEVIDK